ncbi:nitrous oxide reductase accessory protein NosL [Nitrogeniibacter mangrovi]|uniref:Nitrous oxide reductase accessory protein NosL n=1 Tax=Nitrogeniibacter mangrovi TaxID=2016596 RepID=A0A6C1B8G7_9RHOO|nr:nitrous oxide reductase accessory protein NosL [Nitrogeniibacter mangrovi]QID19115.1 nitrous oxide reductase accessory protein NosL [Nitrogeniibacter mangrovi]
MIFSPRFLPAAALAATVLLAGCGKQAGEVPAVPVNITAGTTCVLDGMLLANFPGPKAQILYDGAAEPDFFCDTVEMFNVYLQPEQARRVRAVFVQDMGKADWNKPRGHWIDATQAFYVLGSDARGSMGPTIAAFAQEADARTFAKAHGGKVATFNEVTPDQVVLDGGVLKDHKM